MKIRIFIIYIIYVRYYIFLKLMIIFDLSIHLLNYLKINYFIKLLH